MCQNALALVPRSLDVGDAPASSTSHPTQVSEVNAVYSAPSQQSIGKNKTKNKPKKNNTNEQPKAQNPSPATKKQPQ